MRGAADLVRFPVALGLFWSCAAHAQTADAALANARRLVAGDPCGAVGDEVVVCGRGDADLRHRLPLPAERAAPVPAMRDGGSPIASITPHAPCGIFAGERRYAPAEARLYGYGGGRDPLTLGVRLAKRLLDPDAVLEPLPGSKR